MKIKTKDLTIIALLSALAYVVMVVGRVPVVLFLKYDPKDIVITMGGFIYGPMMAVLMSVVVSVVELVTVSTTGIIGLIMNVLSTVAFAVPAAYIFRKTMKDRSLVAGLLAGSILMIIIMLLWNYLITPVYMGVPREEVVKLLVPAILPFNVLKSVLNSALIFLLYKPFIRILENVTTIKMQPAEESPKTGYYLIALLAVLTAILYILVQNQII